MFTHVLHLFKPPKHVLHLFWSIFAIEDSFERAPTLGKRITVLKNKNHFGLVPSVKFVLLNSIMFLRSLPLISYWHLMFNPTCLNINVLKLLVKYFLNISLILSGYFQCLSYWYWCFNIDIDVSELSSKCFLDISLIRSLSPSPIQLITLFERRWRPICSKFSFEQ